jgi:hypothetical protein
VECNGPNLIAIGKMVDEDLVEDDIGFLYRYIIGHRVRMVVGFITTCDKCLLCYLQNNNATFNNILVISSWSVLLVGET